MSTIVARMKEYLDQLNIKPSVAESQIGVSNGTLSKPFNKHTSIKTDTLEKFLFFYTNINPIWLLTGEGSIDKNELLSVSSAETDKEANIYQNKLIQMQEKEIARLEKELELLKATGHEKSKSRTAVEFRDEPKPELKR